MRESCDQIGAGLDHRGYAVIGVVRGDDGGPGPEAAFDRLADEGGKGSVRIPPTARLVRWLLGRPAVSAVIERTLGPAAKPVRAIAFEKTTASNWSVPWHQDRTIAVERRIDAAAVRNWSVKGGVPHCEAPVRLLERMLTLRWHLDPVGLEDGCLRVLPESHRRGRLTSERIAALLPEQPPRDLPVQGGSVLAMRPLLVHSSRRRATPGRRRVLHVELAAGDPPAPLRWAWA